MGLQLGCIADDITGASDLGLMLASHGMPATLCLGVPAVDRVIETPAVIIALKIRTVEPALAIAAASEAADWLLSRTPRQLLYKYCSTFDSTERGNIGPVTEALLARLDTDFTILAPSFPDNGRTVRDGILYVNGTPLANSPMRHHPLTPMTESSLVRLMDRQTANGSTGCVSIDTVREGEAAVRDAFKKLRDRGCRFAVPDSEDYDDLQTVSDAASNLKLLTGGSGIAAAIPETLRKAGALLPSLASPDMPQLDGFAAVLAGSCSAATQAQVQSFSKRSQSIRVDPVELYQRPEYADELAETATRASASGDVIVFSTAEPESLREVHDAIGVSASAKIVEDALSRIATRLADSGIRKFVIAGGETSGAVANALAIRELSIGPQIDPGVPWMIADGDNPVCLAFKSGNFGGEDFFERAIGMLP